MSQIVFSKAFDMLESQDWAYNITKSTSDTLTLQGRANSLTIHGDLNYWLDGVHGEISSATYSTNGSIAYELTVSGSLDAHKMQSLLEAGDTQALYAHILGGNDLLDASTAGGAQTLLGYNGNDRIEAGIDNDVLLGGNGNDVLLGQLGNDTLRGGADNDSLYGGAGNDTLVGGAGNDRFIFNGNKMGLDTITDLDVTTDTIVLFSGNAQTFQNLGNASGELAGRFFAANGKGNAVDSNDRILFDTNSGELYYDADGNGAGAKVQFGVVGLSAGQTLSAADFTVEYFGLA